VWQNVSPESLPETEKTPGNRRLQVVPHAFAWALRASVVLVAITGQAVRAHQVASDPPVAQCELSLQRVEQTWNGVCGPLFQQHGANNTNCSNSDVASGQCRP
jgi:hypothetical protein